MSLSESDKYALARALQGLEPAVMSGVSPLVQMLVDNWRGRTPDRDDLEQARKWFGPTFAPQVFAADPNAPPPALLDENYVPRLPKWADASEIECEKATGAWLDEFMRWSQKRAAMTDPLFLEAGGLWLLSLATARRAALHLDFKTIYNPIYILWCAGTTYWRKSTGLRAVDLLARRTIEHLLIPSQATPEMLLWRLTGKLPVNFDDLSATIQALEQAGQAFAGQRGFISDEASKLFDKDYLKGLPELFLEMDDMQRRLEKEFKALGRLVVESPGLSLLFATTPARLGAVFGDREWEDGLLPRFALLTPERSVVRRVHTLRASAQHEPSPALIMGLRALYDKLPEPANGDVFERQPKQLVTMDVRISDGALDRFNLYADALHDFCAPNAGLDERLTGVYGRLPELALRISMSLMLIEWAVDDKSPEIDIQHWRRAQVITEKWRTSAHRLLNDLNRSGDQKNEDRILDFLRMSHPRPPSKFEVYRGAKIHDRTKAYAAIEALMEDGKIALVDSGGRRGYELARGN